MFDILVYLFEKHTKIDYSGYFDTEDDVIRELLIEGFELIDIKSAIDWISDLVDLQEIEMLGEESSKSFRIYTRQEKLVLNSESREFLLFLEKNNIITSKTRELVIDRALNIGKIDIDLISLKWIILMVLFNMPGEEYAYEQVNDLMYQPTDGIYDS